MSKTPNNIIGRRAFLAAGAATLAAPAFAQTDDSTEVERDLSESVRRNISSFRSLDWHPYFDSLRNGAILVDTTSRALHYWNEAETIYKLYPTSVPLTEDLTRRGRTEIIRKVEGPSWRPHRRCAFATPSGPSLSARVRTIRSARTRFT